MTEISVGTNRASCRQIQRLLERALVEESLSEEEQRTVDRHLATCRECREFATLTGGLSGFADTLTKTEIDRAIGTAMTEGWPSVTDSSPPIARRRPTKVFVAAAAVAAILVVGSVLSGLFATGPDAVTTCSPTAPIEAVSGVMVAHCDGSQVLSTDINDLGDLTISLEAGTVGLLVDPERDNKRSVTVTTPLGSVMVKGTIFTVEIMDKDVRVEVFRGVVDIEAKAEDFVPRKIRSGHGALIGEATTFPLSAPKTEKLKNRLLEAAPKKKAPKGQMLTDATEPRSLDAPPPPTAAETDDASMSTEERDTVTSGKTARAQRRSIVTFDTLIQDAQSCLIDKNWRCAASKYQKILSRYGRRPESLPVLISLAKIELRHLNAPQKALSHYKSYTDRAPDGILAEEAHFGIAAAYQRLGAKQKAQETLRRFINRYPQSPLKRKAENRLKQLGGV